MILENANLQTERKKSDIFREGRIWDKGTPFQKLKDKIPKKCFLVIKA